MKKWAVGFMSLVLILSFSTSSFAILRKDMDAVKGKVVSINAAQSQITVKDSSGQEHTFTVKRGVDPSWQIGTNVTVIYKKGSNLATNVSIPKKYR